MELVDTHAHLSFFNSNSERTEVMKRAKQAGVTTLIEVGVNLESSAQAVELAKNHNHIFATCGIHPTDGQNDTQSNVWEEKLIALVQQPKVVAVGECGLDYYHRPHNKTEQQILFVKQLEIAVKFDLPVIIHCRQAWDDLFTILSSFPQIRGIFHCWSGGPKEAQKALNFNFLFGFGALLTYKNTQDIAMVAKTLPIWRLVLETDSPFLPPSQLKGERNEPANLTYAARKLAAIRNLKIEDLATATTYNARKFLMLSD